MTERAPIPMRLPCPACGELHIDEGWPGATKPHHTHACQKCGNVWRPAIVATVGVRFLPGFKNSELERETTSPDAPPNLEEMMLAAYIAGANDAADGVKCKRSTFIEWRDRHWPRPPVPVRCGVEGCRLPPDHDGLHAFENNIP